MEINKIVYESGTEQGEPSFKFTSLPETFDITLGGFTQLAGSVEEASGILTMTFPEEVTDEDGMPLEILLYRDDVVDLVTVLSALLQVWKESSENS